MTVKPIVTDIKDVRHFQPYPDLKDKTPAHFYRCGNRTPLSRFSRLGCNSSRTVKLQVSYTQKFKSKWISDFSITAVTVNYEYAYCDASFVASLSVYSSSVGT